MSFRDIVQDKLKSKMSQDVIWTFGIQMVIMLCAFAVNKILSVRLGVDGFGAYNVVKRSVVVISFVMLAGAGISIPRFLAMYLGEKNFNRAKAFMVSAFYYVLTIVVFVCVISLIFKSLLSDLIIGSDDRLLYFTALVYSISLTSSNFIFAYFRGKNDFRIYNVSQVLVQLALLVPILIIDKLTLLNIFGYWTLSTFMIVAVFYFLDRRGQSIAQSFKPEKQQVRTEIGIIAKYSLPRLVGDFFLFTFSAFPVIYLNKCLDSASVSYYSVGINIVTIATPLYSILGTILLPYVSKCLSTGEFQKAELFVNKLSLIYILSSLVLIACFYFLTHFLIIILFSADYLPAEKITQILILSILPQSLYLLYRNPIDAVSVTPYNTIVLGICLTLLVVLYCLNTTLEQFAWSYVAVSVVQGVGSLGIWKWIRKKC